MIKLGEKQIVISGLLEELKS